MPRRPRPDDEDPDYFNPIIGGSIVIGSGEHQRNFSNEADDLLASLKIDPNNLMEEAANNSAIFARWGVLSEEAASESRWCERELGITKAECMDDMRRRTWGGEEKKPTVDGLKALVEMDDKVMAAYERLLDAQRAQGLLRVIANSIKDRREMIAEMMRTSRKEWEGSSD